MSQTFKLYCPETHQYIWIGQGWGSMTTFYTGEPWTMQRLQDFLNAHRGKALYFVESQERDTAPWDDGADWHEWGLPEEETGDGAL